MPETLTFTYTFTSSSPHGGRIVVGALPTVLSPTFNCTLAWDRNLGTDVFHGFIWVHFFMHASASGADCHSWYFQPSGDAGSLSGGINMAAATCGDYDQLQIGIDATTIMPPVGTVFTITLVGDFASTTICQYGTEKITAAQDVVEAGLGLLDALGVSELAPWAVPTIVATVATPLVLDVLCSGPPPTDTDIEPGDWLTIPYFGAPNLAVLKILDKFKASAWNHFCK